jgi:hypothetical protein
MPARDAMQKELEDVELKLRNAREAAAAPQATERDKSDLRLIEQEHVAARQKVRRALEGGSSKKGHPADAKGKLDMKLDEALDGTFPGSDPIAFVEAAPLKEEDRSLPVVKVAEQQARKKTRAARRAE